MVLNKNGLRQKFGSLLSSSIFVLAFLVIQPSVIAQDDTASNYNEYKGMVIDGKTKKSLEYASISVSNSNISTISNLDGVFLLKVPDDLKSESVIITYLGYQRKTIPLSSFGKGEMKIGMEESFEEFTNDGQFDTNN